MAIMATVASWFGKQLGSDKALSNILDKDKGLLVRAGSWVDNMSYTDQEKAKAGERTREWGLRHLDALAPFKIVQRALAFTIAGMWVFGGLNYFLAFWIEAFTDMTGLREGLMAFLMSQYFSWPIFIVFALYFSGGVINSVKNGSNQK